MINFVLSLNKELLRIRYILILLILTLFTGLTAQDEAFREHRMGTLVIHADPGTKVKIEQLSHEFWFGCAISNGAFNGSFSEKDRSIYLEKFLENFNAAVTENAVKWGTMEREQGEVNYRVVDEMLDWTEQHQVPLRAHNLFWGIPKYVQPWLKEMSDDGLENIVQNRAESITSRYRGRFAEYDLNNEMIHGNYYEERLGPDITLKMSSWARTGDPGIVLYLNDYDILTGNQLDKFMSHIRELTNQGVPIGGIGVQGHLHGATFDRDELKRSLDSLATFGLPVRITEFNVPGQRSDYYRDRVMQLDPEASRKNARELKDYYEICFAHPAVEGILMWGFWAGANWIPASSMYTKDWQLTETGKAYRELVFKRWWTNETKTTEADGKCSVPAFYGTYKVTVDGKTHKIEFPKEAGELSLYFSEN